ncbi:hypothetical protein SPFM14_00281 [Salmonella phage SPFM14]|nr:hypothetical protein SPFM14_00281 [Salmonella phage SPFM14]
MQSLELHIHALVENAVKAAKHPFNRYASTEYLIGLAFEDCYNSFLDSSSGGLGTPVNKTKETVAILRLVADQIILPPKTVPVERTHVNARMEPLLEPYTDAFNLTMITVQLLHTALEDIFYSVPEMPVDASQYATALRMSQKEREMFANVVRIYLEPAAVHSSFWGPCYFGVGPKP